MTQIIGIWGEPLYLCTVFLLEVDYSGEAGESAEKSATGFIKNESSIITATVYRIGLVSWAPRGWSRYLTSRVSGAPCSVRVGASGEHVDSALRGPLRSDRQTW